jgi:hypothetical protein
MPFSDIMRIARGSNTYSMIVVANSLYWYLHASGRGSATVLAGYVESRFPSASLLDKATEKVLRSLFS